MKTEVISKDTLGRYRALILPSVYEELRRHDAELDTYYLCLAAVPDGPAAAAGDGPAAAAAGGPVSVLVAQMEDSGDLLIISLYTLPEERRKGYASYLKEQLLTAARGLFLWEEGETEADIYLKTLYRLPEGAEAAYDAFLKKNGFTEFYLLDEEERYNTWCALAEVRFYMT